MTIAVTRRRDARRASRRDASAPAMLERELDGIASAHVEDLSAALPGFAEAMAWPPE
ncbi:MAG TPA: hypothetical protein VNN08_18080 [Thermoanaerobaculia bacterium]|nr:hypothetical protein [Thermoanaerobaculia bacterium]